LIQSGAPSILNWVVWLDYETLNLGTKKTVILWAFKREDNVVEILGQLDLNPKDIGL